MSCNDQSFKKHYIKWKLSDIPLYATIINNIIPKIKLGQYLVYFTGSINLVVIIINYLMIIHCKMKCPKPLINYLC